MHVSHHLKTEMEKEYYSLTSTQHQLLRYPSEYSKHSSIPGHSGRPELRPPVYPLAGGLTKIPLPADFSVFLFFLSLFLIKPAHCEDKPQSSRRDA
jgi:hypothetical protein